ncbi:MAG TPA: DUF2207 domain-containing protein [Terriglobales bacterium]|nr:DUF2207 domain-containing protein [Terriglobales bacterium]
MLALLVTSAPCLGAHVSEWHTTRFACDIVVQPDGSLLVQEKEDIDLVAPPKYGLRRNLPIGSDDRWDRDYGPGYTRDTGLRVQLNEVKLDGAAAPFHTSQMRGSYYQVVFGSSENALLPVEVGSHTVEITYHVTGAIRFLQDYDELYWNALGHVSSAGGNATVRVHLPAGVPDAQVRTSSRAGGRGVSSPRNAVDPPVVQQALPDDREFSVEALRPYQSLAVVVRWPKGYVRPPQWWDPAHLPLLVAPVLLLAFYLIVRLFLRRHQERGTVLPQYTPPRGLSPAALRYVLTGGADGTSVAAVLARFLTKGAISATAIGSGYTLVRQPAYDAVVSKLLPEEAAIGQELFNPAFNFGEGSSSTSALREEFTALNVSDEATAAPATVPATNRSPDEPISLGIADEATSSHAPAAQDRITLNEGDPRINVFVGMIYSRLHAQIEGKYFRWNIGFVLLGALATFVFALVWGFRDSTDTFGSAFLTVWIMFFLQILGAMVSLGIHSARVPSSFSRWLLTIFGLGVVFGLPLLVARELARQTSWPLVYSLLTMIALNSVFIPLLRTMTADGRKLQDEIAGYKDFLREVEQDRLDRLGRIAKAPPMAETLPYAIALGLSEAWGDALATAFSQATIAR